MSSYPLRVSREDWQDIREHYEEKEPADWTDMPVEEIPFPEPDDHDRRFSDMYDTLNGDIEDEIDPPY